MVLCLAAEYKWRAKDCPSFFESLNVVEIKTSKEKGRVRDKAEEKQPKKNC